MIVVKTAMEIGRIRENGALVAEVLDRLGEAVQPGVTTADLDRMGEEAIRAFPGATPSFKGYNGYPASICTSVNDEVVHGIPSPRRRLEQGDIVSVDVGVHRNGWHADSARTFPVGEIAGESRRLLEVTEECLYRGIAEIAPGRPLGDLSAAIQEHAEAAGFSVVRELVGHGIGRHLHEDPQVPNYGTRGTGLRLRAGMVLAVEPMVNAGTATVETLEDDWTIRTVDGSRSAHFEHTVTVTLEGSRILTSAMEPVTGAREGQGAREAAPSAARA
ncbi:MAG: type I methionyl aminopeptidase [Gemmatimonadetes bacterium]|nr:type I methionyl aminopeptidase [Gemmatimonadota bacterium]